MKLSIGAQRVEGLLEALTLSKTRSEAAATLTATVCAAAADTYFPKLTLAVGDAVILTGDGGETVFTGAVHTLTRTPSQVRLTAYDRGVYLTRNQLYGVFAGTGGQIVRAVAAALGIQTETVDAQSLWRTIPAASGQSAFSILRQAAGDDREIWMEGERLAVARQRGGALTLAPERVLSVESRSGIGSMVNRGAVLRRGGAVAAVAESAADMAAYGRFQAVRTLSGTDAAAQARALLKGREMTADVTLLGDLAFQCGGTVTANQSPWGLAGTYRLTAVTHRWSGGIFTTEATMEETA